MSCANRSNRVIKNNIFRSKALDKQSKWKASAQAKCSFDVSLMTCEYVSIQLILPNIKKNVEHDFFVVAVVLRAVTISGKNLDWIFLEMWRRYQSATSFLSNLCHSILIVNMQYITCCLGVSLQVIYGWAFIEQTTISCSMKIIYE